MRCSILVVILSVAVCPSACGDTVANFTFYGYSWAQGCFNCTPASLFGGDNDFTALSGLTYKSATLDGVGTVTTTDGQISFDAPPFDPPIPNQIEDGNLGSFLLSGLTADYTGTTFTLQVAIFRTDWLPPVDFAVTGALVGDVSDGAGSVQIVFNPSSTDETYTGLGGGTFVFTINDATAVANGPPVALTGEISSIMANNPEPGPAWLYGLGITLLAIRRHVGRYR